MISRRMFIGGSAALAGSSLMARAAEPAGQAFSTVATDSIEEAPRRIPVVQTCDVCVLGGSCTGVFAAVRAAQLGAKVALVEKQNAFGGVAASALVNIWHKLDSNLQKKPIIGGLTKQVIDRLMAIDAAAKSTRSPGFIINTDELKIELDKLVMDNRITPYLHTFYTAAQAENGTIKAVIIENKSGRQALRAKVFIDATGDGDLARDAGIPFTIRDGNQPPTTCAEISGMPDSLAGLIDAHRQEFNLAKDAGWHAAIPGTEVARLYAMTHVFNVNAADANQLSAAEIEGRRQVRAYMDIARKYGGKKSKPCLLDIGSSIGIRETRSFQARYTLTEEDVLSCRRFPDAIANGTYHVDVHDPKTGVFKFKEPRGDFYQIPLSTMVNDKVRNLVLAGRAISADRGAFGAVRVMVNLNQTGEAAGVTAALAASQDKAVPAVDAQAVRDHLSKLGAIIIPAS